jgi:hypothetical protein
MQSFMGALRPASSPHQATLQSLCKLSTKYFKDKRFEYAFVVLAVSLGHSPLITVLLVQVQTHSPACSDQHVLGRRQQYISPPNGE